MPVQEIEDFGEWDGVPSDDPDSAMATEGGEAGLPPCLAATLLDCISYVLTATDQDRDTVQRYLTTLSAPNQIFSAIKLVWMLA